MAKKTPVMEKLPAIPDARLRTDEGQESDVAADEAQAVRLPPVPASEINTDLTRNILQTGWKWWAVLGFFAAVTGWAAIVFAYQIYDGMGVYGNNRPVYWAVPIINFVFWAGVALSGTMISAILRLLHVGWRRSLTRMTETLTLCALAVAGLFPILHIWDATGRSTGCCRTRTSGSSGRTTKARCCGTRRPFPSI